MIERDFNLRCQAVHTPERRAGCFLAAELIVSHNAELGLED